MFFTHTADSLFLKLFPQRAICYLTASLEARQASFEKISFFAEALSELFTRY
jgi:hypothetical protein